MSGIADIIKAVAPALATALGGPLAGAAVSFLAGKFGTADTQEAVQKSLEGFTAADMVQLKSIDVEFQEHMADLGIKLDMAQIGVNTEEAKSESTFVAGARPFIIWACGFSFVYMGIIEPLMRFIAQVGYNYHGPFPTLDTAMTGQLLTALLGLSGMHLYEKTKT